MNGLDHGYAHRSDSTGRIASSAAFNFIKYFLDFINIGGI